jgi:hypothetical protein
VPIVLDIASDDKGGYDITIDQWETSYKAINLYQVYTAVAHYFKETHSFANCPLCLDIKESINGII